MNITYTTSSVSARNMTGDFKVKKKLLWYTVARACGVCTDRVKSVL